MVDASVILCTQGQHPLLGHTVAALRDQVDIDLEVLVVVDGDAGELSTRLGAGDTGTGTGTGKATVRVIEERSRGLNTKRNRGIREARADRLLFTDDDCVPSPAWACRLAKALTVHPVVTARVVALNDGYRVSVRPSTRARTFRGSMLDLLLPWTAGCGNNLGVRREVFDRVGTFCEGLGVGTWSGAACDTEFLFRVMRTKDLEVHFDPSAVVYHEQPKDRANYLEKRRLYYRGASYMVSRLHRRDLMAWAMATVRIVSTGAELVLAAISLRRSMRERTWAQWRGAVEGLLAPEGVA